MNRAVIILALIALAQGASAQRADQAFLDRCNAQAAAYRNYGIYCEVHTKDYAGAIACYKRSAELFGEARNDSARAIEIASILNLYFYLGDYPDAMQVSVHELEDVERKGDKRAEAHFDDLIGFVYFQEGNVAESGRYYSNYLNLARTLGDSVLEAAAYVDLADYRTAMRDYRGALDYLTMALERYRQLRKKERQNFTAFKISQVEQDLGRYPQALSFALKPLEDSVPANKYDLASYEVNAGNVYEALGKDRLAVAWLHRGLMLATSIQHREDIKDAYGALSRVFAKAGRMDSAYYYQVRYAELKDSLVNDHARLQIEEIHTRYEVGKKDQEIAFLNQQRLLEEARLERAALIRNIVIISCVFLLVLAGLLYNWRRLRQRAAQEAAEHRQQNDLFHTMIAVRDQEQKRIARDIHDSLGSLLSAAKLNLSAIEEDPDRFNAEQRERYRATMALLDEAAAELRLVSHNIMPAILTRNGLEAAIQGFLDKLSPHPELQINYSTHGFTERLPEQMEIMVYRIVLELINNVIKHARATELTVQLIRYPDYVNIVVEDNGTGFKVVPGADLKSVSSRVSLLKGMLDIDSQIGVGTTVVIDVPCGPGGYTP